MGLHRLLTEAKTFYLLVEQSKGFFKLTIIESGRDSFYSFVVSIHSAGFM